MDQKQYSCLMNIQWYNVFDTFFANYFMLYVGSYIFDMQKLDHEIV